MISKDLKKIFGHIAKDNGFKTVLGIWYKENSECIFMLSLQKSEYEDRFYLNLKIFVQGIFGPEYKLNNSLKNDTGDIFLRSPKEHDDYFNFENELSADQRNIGLNRLFKEYINPFAEKALTIKGILELENDRNISILPAVKEELEKMMV